MARPDEGLVALQAIRNDFDAFLRMEPHATEADTRAQLIDRILYEVLKWPRDSVKRELHSMEGYLDYTVQALGKRYMVVEAKKAGVPLPLPKDSAQLRRRYALDGVIRTVEPLKTAIDQVQKYCSDEGIRYAIVTNGDAWFVFRALREDRPWRKGEVRAFPSLKDISDHFVDFWNLLSYDAVGQGALEEEFGDGLHASRSLHRVSANLRDSDTPLQRNRLHSQLDPFISAFFADIATQDEVEILKQCYVHTASLKICAHDLGVVIEDSIPAFLKDEGAIDVDQGADDSGVFGDQLTAHIETHAKPPRSPEGQALPKGKLFLLLGGIGAGKTTFLRRYQRTVAKELLESNTIWFHVDFLGPPSTREEVAPTIWSQIRDELRNKYQHLDLEKRSQLKKAMADKIGAVKNTLLRGLHENSEEFEERLSPLLYEWQNDIEDYIPRILKRHTQSTGRRIILFIDNVDHLPSEYQSTVFLVAQRITEALGSLTVIALREESYYSASVQRLFTAYTNQKFHIASPRFRQVIGSRIKFALRDLEKGAESRIVKTTQHLDAESISTFLRIVQYSVFVRNQNIANFVDAINFGNTRSALQMFATFLTSGATDVDKMLRIVHREKVYYVAFHEFVKSVMLGDRRFYKESHSPLLNVFNVGSERNSSHFTALRVLELLLAHRNEDHREGRGYVDIQRLLAQFDDVFGNPEDVLSTLNRLVSKQLIEVNTKSIETAVGATYARVTSAGWYYSRTLVPTFTYLDLVLQDTPFSDSGVEHDIRRSVIEVDNLSDKDEEKIPRLQARFDRVRKFIGYLKKEEAGEKVRYGLEKPGSVFGFGIISAIAAKVEPQIERIFNRVRENQERYAEQFDPEPNEEAQSSPGVFDDSGDASTGGQGA